jgi:hypothetical protein
LRRVLHLPGPVVRRSHQQHRHSTTEERERGRERQREREREREREISGPKALLAHRAFPRGGLREF